MALDDLAAISRGRGLEEELADADADRSAERVEKGGLVAERSFAGGVGNVQALVEEIVDHQTGAGAAKPGIALDERALLAEGVELKIGATIERIEASEGRIRASLTRDGVSETVEGSHLLVAAGRRPVTDGLGLESAGIAHDRGGITVDRGLRTTNRRVYAIGDCAGPEAGAFKFTHVANYHAGLVIRSALFRLPVKVDTAEIPRVTYTDPELASVGLTEE